MTLTMSTFKVAALASALVVAGSLVGIQGAAAVSPVTLPCGALVTTSIVLANDVGPCPEDGILVRADNITIDLGGHQVFGIGGTLVPHQAAGVFATGHSVVVRNGTVHDFYHGVRIRAGGHNRVTGLTVRDNVGGNGIVFESSADNVADHNVVYHNSGFSGIATFDTNSLPPPRLAARNTISDNVVSFNYGRTHGISIENGSSHKVLRNRVDSNGRDGISVSGGVFNIVVEHNAITASANNGIDIRSGANANIVRTNETYGNLQQGIVVSGHGNQITGNASRANGQFDLQDTNPGCDSNMWSANVFGTASPSCAGGGG